MEAVDVFFGAGEVQGEDGIGEGVFALFDQWGGGVKGMSTKSASFDSGGQARPSHSFLLSTIRMAGSRGVGKYCLGRGKKRLAGRGGGGMVAGLFELEM